MYITWHFVDDKPQILGVFDEEKDAQEACELYDCYHFIEKNKIYQETEYITDIAFYKTDEGFKTYEDIVNK